MSISAGSKLGSYKITGPIGAGGMGEVYRARDTKLDRDVAIKVLPEKFAEDTERLARFEREAKLLASLNHTNIASIYGLEENALVLELVEGPTLAERIAEGPIPVDEANAIAKQIAKALEAGHEAGIIHRDLKPANIKLKDDGTVKVLDYGLAKAFEGDVATTADSELSQSPTLTRHGTQVGVILGTAAYMSPEQAKGKRVDKRTDIWAFGAVVYEMLTGKRAFAAEDVSETLAYVLTREPDWESMPADTPSALAQALRVCLTKDAKRRAHDIADVRLAMEGVFETRGEADSAPPTSRGRTFGIAAVAALSLSIITGTAVWRITRPEPTPHPVARFSLPLSPEGSLTGTTRHAVEISRDGTHLAYSLNDRLYTRALDQMAAAPVRGTEGAEGPFFSPDGEWIGFWSEGQLQKVSVNGGTPVRLSDTGASLASHWQDDDTILYGDPEHAQAMQAAIMQVSANGGNPEVLFPISETGEVGRGPRLLPGGKAVLFTLWRLGSWEAAQIAVHSLETGETTVLIDRGRDARYLSTGHLVYMLDGTLLAVPFDAQTLALTGGPVPVAENLLTESGAWPGASYSISDNGTLAYLTGSDLGERTLVWVDRNGNEESLAAEPRTYSHPRVSPDGRRLAVQVLDRGDTDIWIWDFALETMTRLTFAPGRDSSAIWTPDGSRMIFTSVRDGIPNLYWKAADGSGDVERLTESEAWHYSSAITSDGKHLVFWAINEGRVDLRMLALDGAEEPLLEKEGTIGNGVISPDGRWFAYQSNNSGQFEVYVRPFPKVEDGKWSISRDGGTKPVWSPDGRELFFMTPDGTLTAVDVDTEPSFAPGRTTALFGGYWAGTFHRTYDISPDGRRFLMVKEGGGDAPPELVIVLNWFEELKRLVPTDN